MTIEPVSHKGAAFASSLAHDTACLTVTLLKLSDNRLDRLFSRAIPPSFPYTDPTAREVGQHGNYRIIFQARPQGGKPHPFCGARATSSFPTIGLPTLTPKALSNTHV